MVIPGTIQRILATTVLCATVLGLYWAQRDGRGALVFGCAVAWAMANLVAWSAFSHLLLRPVEGKGPLLIVVGLAKVILLAVGLIALKFTSPLGRGEVVGLVVGLSLCLFVTLLMAVGARLTGREMSDGQPESEKRTAAAGTELGGGV